MKPHEEGKESLDRALREWSVKTPVPPRFGEEVWRRIALAEARPSSSSWVVEVWRSIEVCLRRPALALSYLAILLLIGLSAGLAQARQASARMDETLEARYLHAVDPYLTRGH